VNAGTSVVGNMANVRIANLLCALRPPPREATDGGGKRRGEVMRAAERTDENKTHR
jgi:hypothetical protein